MNFMNTFYKTTYQSPVGTYVLACDKFENLIGVWLVGQKYFCSGADILIEEDSLKIFRDTKIWLDNYFEGKKPNIKSLPLAPIGNNFRQAVWAELCKIPYGKVTTYGKIAKEIARQRGLTKMSAQAIGGAVGHNPISIIIPCHRVIAQNGSLIGYAGGIDVKKKLLELEKTNHQRR